MALTHVKRGRGSGTDTSKLTSGSIVGFLKEYITLIIFIYYYLNCISHCNAAITGS